METHLPDQGSNLHPLNWEANHWTTEEAWVDLRFKKKTTTDAVLKQTGHGRKRNQETAATTQEREMEAAFATMHVAAVVRSALILDITQGGLPGINTQETVLK